MRFAVGCLLVPWVLGCSIFSDESGSSSLVEFDGSPCKSHLEMQHGNESVFRVATEQYDGLRCIVWEPNGENLTIALTNFKGGCEVPWEARAWVPAPDKVELLVANNSGGGADCGWCIYDWVFEISGVTTNEAVTLTFTQDPGEGFGDPETSMAVLPMDETPSGVMCQYAHQYALSQYAENTGRYGERFMPCLPDGVCTANLTCAAGTDANSMFCHPTCAGEAECSSHPGTACRDGLCRPTGW